MSKEYEPINEEVNEEGQEVAPITIGEMDAAIPKIKLGKVLGIDEISTPDKIKYLEDTGKENFRSLVKLSIKREYQESGKWEIY